MNAFKNYTIAVLFIAVLILGAICVNSGRRLQGVDRQSGVLRDELATGYERINSLESEYSRVTKENAELRAEISEGLTGLYDGASNLEKRLQDITNSGRGLSDEMRSYLP